MNSIELEKEVKNLVHTLRYEKGLVCAVDTPRYSANTIVMLVRSR